MAAVGLVGPNTFGSDSSYAMAVAQALAEISSGPPSAAAAQRAHATLRAGTGSSQPEILADLEATPPRLEDARARLGALDDALRAPVAPRDSAAADARLAQVLADARYHPQATWWTELLDRLARWFQGVPGLVLLVLVVVGIVVVVLRAVARVGREEQADETEAAAAARARAVDHFDEADRLAAARDYGAAVRALTTAAVVALGGEASWEHSPLTVREMFAEAGRLEALRPLLLAFETSFYGHQRVDLRAYRKAEAATAALRGQPDEAAA